MTPEVPNKEKGPLLPRIGSSRYRYAGRTQYQSRLASSLLDRPAPAFQRNPSQHVPNSFSLDSGMNSRAQQQPSMHRAPDEGVGFIDAKSSGDNLEKSRTVPTVTSGTAAKSEGPALNAETRYRGAPVIPYASHPGTVPQVEDTGTKNWKMSSDLREEVHVTSSTGNRDGSRHEEVLVVNLVPDETAAGHRDDHSAGQQSEWLRKFDSILAETLPTEPAPNIEYYDPSEIYAGISTLPGEGDGASDRLLIADNSRIAYLNSLGGRGRKHRKQKKVPAGRRTRSESSSSSSSSSSFASASDDSSRDVVKRSKKKESSKEKGDKMKKLKSRLKFGSGKKDHSSSSSTSSSSSSESESDVDKKPKKSGKSKKKKMRKSLDQFVSSPGSIGIDASSKVANVPQAQSASAKQTNLKSTDKSNISPASSTSSLSRAKSGFLGGLCASGGRSQKYEVSKQHKEHGKDEVAASNARSFFSKKPVITFDPPETAPATADSTPYADPTKSFSEHHSAPNLAEIKMYPTYVVEAPDGAKLVTRHHVAAAAQSRLDMKQRIQDQILRTTPVGKPNTKNNLMSCGPLNCGSVGSGTKPMATWVPPDHPASRVYPLSHADPCADYHDQLGGVVVERADPLATASPIRFDTSDKEIDHFADFRWEGGRPSPTTSTPRKPVKVETPTPPMDIRPQMTYSEEYMIKTPDGGYQFDSVEIKETKIISSEVSINRDIKSDNMDLIEHAGEAVFPQNVSKLILSEDVNATSPAKLPVDTTIHVETYEAYNPLPDSAIGSDSLSPTDLDYSSPSYLGSPKTEPFSSPQKSVHTPTSVLEDREVEFTTPDIPRETVHPILRERSGSVSSTEYRAAPVKHQQAVRFSGELEQIDPATGSVKVQGLDSAKAKPATGLSCFSCSGTNDKHAKLRRKDPETAYLELSSERPLPSGATPHRDATKPYQAQPDSAGIRAVKPAEGSQEVRMYPTYMAAPHTRPNAKSNKTSAAGNLLCAPCAGGRKNKNVLDKPVGKETLTPATVNPTVVESIPLREPTQPYSDAVDKPRSFRIATFEPPAMPLSDADCMGHHDPAFEYCPRDSEAKTKVYPYQITTVPKLSANRQKRAKRRQFPGSKVRQRAYSVSSCSDSDDLSTCSSEVSSASLDERRRLAALRMERPKAPRTKFPSCFNCGGGLTKKPSKTKKTTPLVKPNVTLEQPQVVPVVAAETGYTDHTRPFQADQEDVVVKPAYVITFIPPEKQPEVCQHLGHADATAVYATGGRLATHVAGVPPKVSNRLKLAAKPTSIEVSDEETEIYIPKDLSKKPKKFNLPCLFCGGSFGKEREKQLNMAPEERAKSTAKIEEVKAYPSFGERRPSYTEATVGKPATALKSPPVSKTAEVKTGKPSVGLGGFNCLVCGSDINKRKPIGPVTWEPPREAPRVQPTTPFRDPTMPYSEDQAHLTHSYEVPEKVKIRIAEAKLRPLSEEPGDVHVQKRRRIKPFGGTGPKKGGLNCLLCGSNLIGGDKKAAVAAERDIYRRMLSPQLQYETRYMDPTDEYHGELLYPVKTIGIPEKTQARLLHPRTPSVQSLLAEHKKRAKAQKWSNLNCLLCGGFQDKPPKAEAILKPVHVPASDAKPITTPETQLSVEGAVVVPEVKAYPGYESRVNAEVKPVKKPSAGLNCLSCHSEKPVKLPVTWEPPSSNPAASVRTGHEDPTCDFEGEADIKHPSVHVGVPPKASVRLNRPRISSVSSVDVKPKPAGAGLNCFSCRGEKAKSKPVVPFENKYRVPDVVDDTVHPGDSTMDYDAPEVAIRYSSAAAGIPEKVQLRLAQPRTPSIESLPKSKESKKSLQCLNCGTERSDTTAAKEPGYGPHAGEVKAYPAYEYTLSPSRNPESTQAGDAKPVKSGGLNCMSCNSGKSAKPVTWEPPVVNPIISAYSGYQDPTEDYSGDVLIKHPSFHVGVPEKPQLRISKPRLPSVESLDLKTAKRAKPGLNCMSCGGKHSAKGKPSVFDAKYRVPDSVEDLMHAGDVTREYEAPEEITRYPTIAVGVPVKTKERLGRVRTPSIESLPKARPKSSLQCLNCASGAKASNEEPVAARPEVRIDMSPEAKAYPTFSQKAGIQTQQSGVPTKIGVDKRKPAKSGLNCMSCVSEKSKKPTTWEPPAVNPVISSYSGYQDPTDDYVGVVEIKHPSFHAGVPDKPKARMALARIPSKDSAAMKTPKSPAGALNCLSCGAGGKRKLSKTIPFDAIYGVPDVIHDTVHSGDPTAEFDAPDAFPAVTNSVPEKSHARLTRARTPSIESLPKGKADKKSMQCLSCGRGATAPTGEAAYEKSEVKAYPSYERVTGAPLVRAGAPVTTKQPRSQGGLFSCAPCSGGRKMKKKPHFEAQYVVPSRPHSIERRPDETAEYESGNIRAAPHIEVDYPAYAIGVPFQAQARLHRMRTPSLESAEVAAESPPKPGFVARLPKCLSCAGGGKSKKMDLAVAPEKPDKQSELPLVQPTVVDCTGHLDPTRSYEGEVDVRHPAVSVEIPLKSRERMLRVRTPSIEALPIVPERTVDKPQKSAFSCAPCSTGKEKKLAARTGGSESVDDSYRPVEAKAYPSYSAGKRSEIEVDSEKPMKKTGGLLSCASCGGQAKKPTAEKEPFDKISPPVKVDLVDYFDPTGPVPEDTGISLYPVRSEQIPEKVKLRLAAPRAPSTESLKSTAMEVAKPKTGFPSCFSCATKQKTPKHQPAKILDQHTRPTRDYFFESMRTQPVSLHDATDYADLTWPYEGESAIKYPHASAVVPEKAMLRLAQSRTPSVQSVASDTARKISKPKSKGLSCLSCAGKRGKYSVDKEGYELAKEVEVKGYPSYDSPKIPIESKGPSYHLTYEPPRPETITLERPAPTVVLAPPVPEITIQTPGRSSDYIYDANLPIPELQKPTTFHDPTQNYEMKYVPSIPTPAPVPTSIIETPSSPVQPDVRVEDTRLVQVESRYESLDAKVELASRKPDATGQIAHSYQPPTKLAASSDVEPSVRSPKEPSKSAGPLGKCFSCAGKQKQTNLPDGTADVYSPSGKEPNKQSQKWAVGYPKFVTTAQEKGDKVEPAKKSYEASLSHQSKTIRSETLPSPLIVPAPFDDTGHHDPTSTYATTALTARAAPSQPYEATSTTVYPAFAVVVPDKSLTRVRDATERQQQRKRGWRKRPGPPAGSNGSVTSFSSESSFTSSSASSSSDEEDNRRSTKERKRKRSKKDKSGGGGWGLAGLCGGDSRKKRLESEESYTPTTGVQVAGPEPGRMITPRYIASYVPPGADVPVGEPLRMNDPSRPYVSLVPPTSGEVKDRERVNMEVQGYPSFSAAPEHVQVEPKIRGRSDSEDSKSDKIQPLDKGKKPGLFSMCSGKKVHKPTDKHSDVIEVKKQGKVASAGRKGRTAANTFEPPDQVPLSSKETRFFDPTLPFKVSRAVIESTTELGLKGKVPSILPIEAQDRSEPYSIPIYATYHTTGAAPSKVNHRLRRYDLKRLPRERRRAEMMRIQQSTDSLSSVSSASSVRSESLISRTVSLGSLTSFSSTSSFTSSGEEDQIGMRQKKKSAKKQKSKRGGGGLLCGGRKSKGKKEGKDSSRKKKHARSDDIEEPSEIADKSAATQVENVRHYDPTTNEVYFTPPSQLPRNIKGGHVEVDSSERLPSKEHRPRVVTTTTSRRRRSRSGSYTSSSSGTSNSISGDSMDYSRDRTGQKSAGIRIHSQEESFKPAKYQMTVSTTPPGGRGGSAGPRGQSAEPAGHNKPGSEEVGGPASTTTVRERTSVLGGVWKKEVEYKSTRSGTGTGSSSRVFGVYGSPKSSTERLAYQQQHDGNLVISDKEQSDLRRAFELFDKDRNGRISPDEIRDVIRSTGMEPNDAWVNRLIKEADMDGNGTIEWREFVRAMGRAGSGLWLGPSAQNGFVEERSSRAASNVVSQQYQQPTATGLPDQRRDSEQPVGAGQQHYRVDRTQPVGTGAGQQHPQYTEQQLKDLRRAFELFDQDRNGHITPQELRDVIRQAGMHPNDEWIAQLINEADADGNGTIEFEEFLRAMSSGWMGLGRSETKPTHTVTRTVTRITITDQQLNELKKQFNLWDKDKNGEITPEELREVLQQSGMDPDEPWVGQFLAECDTNRDGKISWPEFLRLMTLGSQASSVGEPTHTDMREVANYEEAVAASPTTPSSVGGRSQHSPSGITRNTTTTTRRVTRVVISEMQLSELRRMFELWDKDGNGVITPDELHDVIGSAGMNPDDSWVDEFIVECDTNKDGKIQWDEFLRLMTLGTAAEPSGHPTEVSSRSVSHHSSVASPFGGPDGAVESHKTITRVVISADQLNELRKTFEMWDKDGNGFITPEDIRGVLDSAGMDPNADWIDHFITECDSDRDNRISWPEFLRLMTIGSTAGSQTRSPMQTEARVVAHGTVASSPSDFHAGVPESHVERSQEVSEGDPNVRTEKIVNPDGSITTRTVTSKVKTVKQTVRTTQMVPIEASGHDLREEEVSALRQAFDLFDHDKDGRITRDELSEVILNVGKKPTQSWMDQLMHEADKDGSGTIEWAEFLRAMSVGGGLHLRGPSSSSPPFVQTKTLSASYGSPDHGESAQGGVDGGTFMSSQVVDSGGKVIDQETYKTEKDGVVEIKTVKKVMMVHSPDEGDPADPEAALTAAILQATKVDPNVVVERVEYKHQTQS